MKDGKRVLFKFVESENKKAVGVNMVIEETGVLNQVSIEAEVEDKFKVEKYMEFLKNKLQNKNKTSSNQQPILRPVIGNDFQSRSEDDRPRQSNPPLIIRPNMMGGGEYVGPDH